MNGTRFSSSPICGGKTAASAFESSFAGRSHRSELTVWFTHTRTVSRKLPTINATEIIIPVATASATVAMAVRRSVAGSDAAAICPIVPYIARSGLPSADAAKVRIIGDKSEKAITTNSTAA